MVSCLLIVGAWGNQKNQKKQKHQTIQRHQKHKRENKQQQRKQVPAKSDARTKTVKFTLRFHGREPNGAFVNTGTGLTQVSRRDGDQILTNSKKSKKALVLIILVIVFKHKIKI